MSQLLSLMGSPIVRRIAGITSLLVAVVIAILSFVPGQDLPDVHLSDKVEHAIAYLVLAGLICFWLGRERIVRGTIVAVGYGAVPARGARLRCWTPGRTFWAPASARAWRGSRSPQRGRAKAVYSAAAGTESSSDWYTWRKISAQ